MKTFLVTVLGVSDGHDFERGGDAVKQEVVSDSMYGSRFTDQIAEEVLLCSIAKCGRPTVNGIIANKAQGLQVLSFEWRDRCESIVVAIEEKQS